MRIRRFFLPSLVAMLLAAPGAFAAPVFFVDGHGWGHGIGMAQYGAQGFATRDGRAYDWILAHYYRGTTLTDSSVASVRVLLADARRSVGIGSDAQYTVADAQGRRFQLPAGRITLGPGLKITVGGRQRTLASPVRFARGSRFLELGGRAYRGQFVVHSSGGRLRVVNQVRVEDYLYGVVPDEMPPTWALEALKAQAVAARTYALISRRTTGNFDLFADTRSQVYGGVPSEETRSSQAIDATAGKVVTYDGRLAWTFFHSTSGGRTASIQHVWNTTPQPYLVSVPDPHDDLSPYHSWGPFRYGASQLRSRLGSLAPRGSLVDVTVGRNASQRVTNVNVRGTGSRQISGTTFQSRLGLRSSWFSVSVLSLRGDRRVEFGKPARLAGIARGFRTASLEQLGANGTWGSPVALERAADGTFALPVRPRVTTWYRLSSPKGKGIAHRVAVAPLVRFSELNGREALAGFVRPKRAGSDVTVQRFANGAWRTVARTETDAAGRFRAALRVVPGRYRALARVGSGYVQGATPVLTVVAR
jgi:stage II sporulation protein D